MDWLELCQVAYEEAKRHIQQAEMAMNSAEIELAALHLQAANAIHNEAYSNFKSKAQTEQWMRSLEHGDNQAIKPKVDSSL
jgi:hypothetical protein